jgi:predicted transcriptional regulator
MHYRRLGDSPMSVTSVRLQADVEESLEAMAGKLHRTKSWLINQALREFIENQTTEQARWLDTVKAMESVARGEVVSGEAVHDWLRSWGSSREISPPKSGQ